MFLRVCSNDHEWGFEVTDNCIPVVGDTILLWYAMPDVESEDFTDGIVLKREWCLVNEEEEVCLRVKLKCEIPDGYITDSPVWPSVEYSKRKAKLAEELAKIKET